MNNMYSISLILAIVLLLAGPAHAGDEGMYAFNRNNSTDAGQSYACPSMHFLMEAPQAYYRVFGVWPETFQAIIDAGLIRGNLTLDGIHEITPDDNEFNHEFDRIYIYTGPQSPPQIGSPGAQGQLSDSARNDPGISASISRLPQGGTGLSLPVMLPMEAFSASWKEQLNHGSFSDDETAALLANAADLDLQKLFSMSYLCMIGAVQYRRVYGEFPQEWKDFVDTGFCPVTSSMINPKTGQPFAGKGTPFGFEFVEMEDGGFHVRVLDENGQIN